jgi:hypothetical protein
LQLLAINAVATRKGKSEERLSFDPADAAISDNGEDFVEEASTWKIRLSAPS